MQRARWLRCWPGAFCVISLVGIGGGADWPQWGGGDNRNAISDEKGLPDGFDPGGKGDSEDPENVKWTVRLGSYIYGNPTVANGRVFVGTAGGNIFYSDDCLYPVYTPVAGGVGDETPKISGDPVFGSGDAPRPPVPLVPGYTVPNRSAWQTTASLE